MRSSPADVLAQFLIAAGTFGDPEGDPLPDWPLFLDYMPDKGGVPDSCAAVYDTIGFKDGRLMRGPNVWKYGVQVKIRALNPTDAWTKAQEVCDLFEAIARNQITVGFTTYRLDNVSQRSPILPLGVEQGPKQRHMFTINFNVTIEDLGAVELEAPGSASLEATNRFNLTSGVAQKLKTFPLAAGEMAGGHIFYVVVCSDGTDNQVITGKLAFTAENKAGTIEGDVQIFSSNPSVKATAGDMQIEGILDTDTPGEASVSIKVTTSLTPTRFKVYYFALELSKG